MRCQTLESLTGVAQGDQVKEAVRLVITLLGAYQDLMKSVSRIPCRYPGRLKHKQLATLLPISAYNSRIHIIVVTPSTSATFSDIESAFTAAVEMFVRSWSSIPPARREIKQKDDTVLPLLTSGASTAEGTEVVGTSPCVVGEEGAQV